MNLWSRYKAQSRSVKAALAARSQNLDSRNSCSGTSVSQSYLQLRKTQFQKVETPRQLRPTHVVSGVEACLPVMKVLFRALLSQLHPGRSGILAHKAGAGKTSRGDLSTVTGDTRAGKGFRYA